MNKLKQLWDRIPLELQYSMFVVLSVGFLSMVFYKILIDVKKESFLKFEQCVETKLKEPPQGLDVTIYCDRITRQ